MHRTVRTLLAAALVVAGLSGGPALALVEETRAATAATDPYLHLIDVLSKEQGIEAMLPRMLEQARATMLADPDMKEIERDHPGIVSQMMAVMQPALKRQAGRVEEERRGQLREILATRLTLQEATQAADFFGSPLGQRMTKAATSNFTMTNSLTEAIKTEGTISSQAFGRDMKLTQERAQAAISEEDDREARRLLAGQIWFMQFRSLVPRIQELNLRVMNDPGTPEEEAEITALVERVVRKRMAADAKHDKGKD